MSRLEGAGAELVRFQLSPFVKRQFFRDGFNKSGVRLMPTINAEVSALLTSDTINDAIL